MKIAILISGEYRTFGICRKTMKFLDDPRADIYVSTWNRAFYKNKKLNLDKAEEVNRVLVESHLGKKASIRIDPYHIFDNTLKYNSNMIFRWKAGFELIKNSRIKYDYVLVVRPDLFFNTSWPLSLDSIFQYTDTIGSVWKTHPTKLNDVLFASSYATIEKLFNELTVDSWNKASEGDWHIWWYDFCAARSTSIEGIADYDYCSFGRYFITDESDGPGAEQAALDWRDIKLLEHVDLNGMECLVWPGSWSLAVYQTAKDKWDSGYFNKYMNA